MEEHTTSEPVVNLDEGYLQAVTGGTNGRIQHFAGIPKTYDERMLIAQHEKEARQALHDAENELIAGSEKQAAKSYKDAKMHYDMITHITNNVPWGLPRIGHEPPARSH